MATVRKTNPKGIDVKIDQIQAVLEGLSWTNYEIYNRAYKNETNDNLMYEVFTSANDYKEILLDDRYNATSYFVVADNATFDERWNVDVGLIFQLNLNNLYPTVLHRADEEAHNDVSVLLENNPLFDVVGMTKGIRNVYSDLGYGANKFDDLNPFHVFRIDLNINYDQDCCVDC